MSKFSSAENEDKNFKKPLISRKVSDSAFEKILPFSNNFELRDSYVNFFNGLRFGKLLEDLDFIAGRVAYSHTEGWERGLTIVTAACDRIDLLDELNSECDLQILASVNWVGSSSIEIGMKVSSRYHKKWKRVARAYFIMVALLRGKAEPVNHIKPQKKDEFRRFKEGEQRQKERRLIAKTSYLIQPPTGSESYILHNLFLKIRNKGIHGISMNETISQSTLIMHPQFRNVHNKIFGGFLMREAYELAWNISYLYCKKIPNFLSMDHMYFIKPVEIGSILSIKGTVVFTKDNRLMVEVINEVITPQTGEKKTTNVCYFTFQIIENSDFVPKIPIILPHTYEDGLKYLDGVKRFKLGNSKRKDLI